MEGLTCVGFQLRRVCNFGGWNLEGLNFGGFVIWRVCNVEGFKFGGFDIWRVWNLEGLTCGGFQIWRV